MLKVYKKFEKIFLVFVPDYETQKTVLVTLGLSIQFIEIFPFYLTLLRPRHFFALLPRLLRCFTQILVRVKFWALAKRKKKFGISSHGNKSTTKIHSTKDSFTTFNHRIFFSRFFFFVTFSLVLFLCRSLRTGSVSCTFFCVDGDLIENKESKSRVNGTWWNVFELNS